MNNLPKKLREDLAADVAYTRCTRSDVLHDHECECDPATGRFIEWEHAFLYAGKQIQERWAIVSICWYVHRGLGLKKTINEWICINRMTPEDEAKYPRFNWAQRRKYLNSLYGIPSYAQQ